MRTLCIAALLALAACGLPGSSSLGESAADTARAHQLRAEIDQTQRELAEVAATRANEPGETQRHVPKAHATRVARKAEQAALEAKIVRLRLQLEALTGERLPPTNLG